MHGSHKMIYLQLNIIPEQIVVHQVQKIQMVTKEIREDKRL